MKNSDKNTMFRMLFLPLFLLFSNLGLAQDDASFNEELKLRMKIFSALSQIEERAKVEFHGVSVDDIAMGPFESKWHSFFKKEALEYLAELEKELPLNPEQKKLFQTLKFKMDWPSLSGFALQQFLNLKHLARSKGISIVFVCILNTVFQFTVPPFLFSIGQPIAAVVLYYMASDIPVLFAHNMIGKLSLQLKMYRFLGSKAKLFEYQEINYQVRKNLKLSSMDEFIVPLDNQSSLVVEELSIVKKIARRLGLSQDKITTRRLKEFIEQSDIDSPLFEAIFNSKKLSEANKISLVSLQFFEVANTEQIASFKIRFQDSFIPSSSNKTFQLAENWIIETLRSKGIQDFLHSIDNMPSELGPKEALRIWEMIILPEFAKRPEMFTYSKYRRMVKNVPELKARTHLYGTELTQRNFKGLMREYLEDSIYKKNGCLKGHDEVLLKMISY